MNEHAQAGASSIHIRSVAMDIILTIATCGLYNVYVQYVQMNAVNAMVGEERYKFLHWFVLSTITCGIYHLYHEYKKMSDICVVTGQHNSSEPLVILVMSALGLWFVADAIQQARINEFFGSPGV